MNNTLNGYIRSDGKIGFRNHLLIMPLTGCVSDIARRIADKVEGTTYFAHVNGCDLFGDDSALFGKLLEHFATHPNVGGVLFLSMGCAATLSFRIPDKVTQSGRLMKNINTQMCGGTTKTIETGVAAATEMVKELSQVPRQPVDFSSLVIGTKCGASDKNSFEYCHPVVGRACDMLVDKGATVVLSEDCELYAAAEKLAERAVSKDISDKIIAMAKQIRKYWLDRFDIDFADLKVQGFDTQEQWVKQSLAHAAKAGTKQFTGFFDMKEKVQGPGLIILNAPNTDIESMTCQAAAGCNFILFTTGRGTPLGSPAAITVKITATEKTYDRMKENIDLCVAGVIDDTETIDHAAERIVQGIIDSANGRETKAEILRHYEIAVPIRGVTF